MAQVVSWRHIGLRTRIATCHGTTVTVCVTLGVELSEDMATVLPGSYDCDLYAIRLCRGVNKKAVLSQRLPRCALYNMGALKTLP